MCIVDEGSLLMMKAAEINAWSQNLKVMPAWARRERLVSTI